MDAGQAAVVGAAVGGGVAIVGVVLDRLIDGMQQARRTKTDQRFAAYATSVSDAECLYAEMSKSLELFDELKLSDALVAMARSMAVLEVVADEGPLRAARRLFNYAHELNELDLDTMQESAWLSHSREYRRRLGELVNAIRKERKLAPMEDSTEDFDRSHRPK